MIKVFTTSAIANLAGNELTNKFEEWLETQEPNTIEIINIHSNSNNNGWMLVIHYKFVNPQ